MFFENIHQAKENSPYFDGNNVNINYPAHIHSEIELILIKKGRVSVVCEDRQFIAEEGDVCVFMPGEIHSFSSVCESLSYVMKINAGGSSERLDFSVMRADGNPFRRSSDPAVGISVKMEALKTESERKESGYSYKMNSIASDIVCDLVRSSALKKFNTDEKKRHLSALTLLTAVNTFIENRYFEPLTLDNAAEACNLSRYYFAHSFKELTGTTFFDYLTLFRLEKALPQLTYTKKTVAEIAYDCGFSNLRSFNRAFKKHTAFTPSEYRKKFRSTVSAP